MDAIPQYFWERGSWSQEIPRPFRDNAINMPHDLLFKRHSDLPHVRNEEGSAYSLQHGGRYCSPRTICKAETLYFQRGRALAYVTNRAKCRLDSLNSKKACHLPSDIELLVPRGSPDSGIYCRFLRGKGYYDSSILNEPDMANRGYKQVRLPEGHFA